MLKSYFVIAIRNLQKHRSQSMINIIGLAAGMAITLLIGLWIADEFSTLLTVSFQSLKAALMNPVRSLRSE